MSLLLAKGDREKNGDSRRQEAVPVYCNCRSRLMESDRMVCCIPATNGAMDPALLYHHKCGFWIVDIDALDLSSMYIATDLYSSATFCISPFL